MKQKIPLSLICIVLAYSFIHWCTNSIDAMESDGSMELSTVYGDSSEINGSSFDIISVEEDRFDYAQNVQLGEMVTTHETFTSYYFTSKQQYRNYDRVNLGVVYNDMVGQMIPTADGTFDIFLKDYYEFMPLSIELCCNKITCLINLDNSEDIALKVPVPDQAKLTVTQSGNSRSLSYSDFGFFHSCPFYFNENEIYLTINDDQWDTLVEQYMGISGIFCVKLTNNIPVIENLFKIPIGTDSMQHVIGLNMLEDETHLVLLVREEKKVFGYLYDTKLKKLIGCYQLFELEQNGPIKNLSITCRNQYLLMDSREENDENENNRFRVIQLTDDMTLELVLDSVLEKEQFDELSENTYANYYVIKDWTMREGKLYQLVTVPVYAPVSYEKLYLLVLSNQGMVYLGNIKTNLLEDWTIGLDSNYYLGNNRSYNEVKFN